MLTVRVEIGPLESDELDMAAEVLLAILAAIPEGCPAPVIMLVDADDEAE